MKFIISILLFAASGYCQGQTFSTNNRTINNANGIIYFSFDNGTTWENKSNGLPDTFSLTDLAVADGFLGLSAKQNGIFIYDFQKNIWKNIATHPSINYNIDALFFHNGKLFAGTQNGGVFSSDDKGKTWVCTNEGLGNLTIRKFAVFNNKLYVGTNGGLYSLNEKENNWHLEYEQDGLQVNGITALDSEIYIGTNKGVYKHAKLQRDWKQMLTNHSLHNISSDDGTVYAMTYNELFASFDKGNTWQNIQQGLPANLYTFQILKMGNIALAGQWDGVYKNVISSHLMSSNNAWRSSNTGLPAKFAVTEMKRYNNIIVIGCSERKLRNGVTINK
jgi:ligand-binding sensor domain-containing protein